MPSSLGRAAARWVGGARHFVSAVAAPAALTAAR
jgi:hypothetical protein